MKRGKNGLIGVNGNVLSHYDYSWKDYEAAHGWIKNLKIVINNGVWPMLLQHFIMLKNIGYEL
jgi:hypothetical protein